VGFEPTISAGERPQTHTLDRTLTGTGVITFGLTLFVGLTCNSIGIMRMRNICKLYCGLGWLCSMKQLNHQFLHVSRRLPEYFGDRRHCVVNQWTTVQTFTTFKTSYLENNKYIGIVLIKITLRYVK